MFNPPFFGGENGFPKKLAMFGRILTQGFFSKEIVRFVMGEQLKGGTLYPKGLGVRGSLIL